MDSSSLSELVYITYIYNYVLQTNNQKFEISNNSMLKNLLKVLLPGSHT